MNQVVLLSYLLAQTAAGEEDYVREWVEDMLAAINGRPGDIFVVITIVGMLLFTWKKRYRAAAGCLFLVCGMVILRIAISIFFDVSAF